MDRAAEEPALCRISTVSLQLTTTYTVLIATDSLPMSMTLEDCRALVSDDMDRVDEFLTERLASDVVLINQLSSYIIASGGKRLRPQLVLLASAACGYQGIHQITLATVIELIHTATLLHDDVVDASEMRRGNDTANALWGNEAAVLVGDFLYSRSFEMMVDVDNMRVMKILATTTNRIAEGEVMQLMNVRDPELTESRYIEVIQAKTARLFQAATELGGVLAGQPEDICQALAQYGMHLGTAFQIVDDVLDYQSDESTLGKNTGDDLAEGKTTLPLIHALRDGSDAQRTLLRQAISEADVSQMDEILNIIADTQAVEKSLATAREAAEQAVQVLKQVPASTYRDALETLARYSVDRSH